MTVRNGSSDNIIISNLNIRKVNVKQKEGKSLNALFDKLPYRTQIRKLYNLLAQMINNTYNDKYNPAIFSQEININEYFRQNNFQQSESSIKGTSCNNVNSLSNSREEDLFLNEYLYTSLNTNINT